MAETPNPPVRNSRLWPFAVAAVVCVLLYSIHLYDCQQSPLQYMDAVYVNSDMHANLFWAKGIRDQGWLNPVPYHPWANWMRDIAPYSQWLKWWGGEQVFQQSPLYAYVMSVILPHYFLLRVLQALLHVGTCMFLGLLTNRLAGPTAGWIAFWLAALYAPFYAYSWPYLRDGLGWFLTAATLWALTELTESDWREERTRRLASITGVLLGVGYLARETFLLLIPLTWFALCLFAWKRKQWGVMARVVIATVFAVSPLMVRNLAVHAPLLSSSNRSAEVFILGNAYSSSPTELQFPVETGPIFQKTNGRTLAVIWATIESHPNGLWGWLNLQGKKALSLLDPFESPDNLSMYFVATISPVVRFGLKYWMILVPGLAGVLLSAWRREPAEMWLWIFLPVVVASVFIGVPTSRYRQSLMIFFIPFAACFVAWLWSRLREREYPKVAFAAAALLVGWGLVLGPFARQPRRQYERAAEYLMAGWVYQQLGDEQRSKEMLDLVRRRFPETKLPSSSEPAINAR